eukprot:scaffold276632_cov19-Tisochrysis_lutea.AAC.1
MRNTVPLSSSHPGPPSLHHPFPSSPAPQLLAQGPLWSARRCSQEKRRIDCCSGSGQCNVRRAAPSMPAPPPRCPPSPCSAQQAGVRTTPELRQGVPPPDLSPPSAAAAAAVADVEASVVLLGTAASCCCAASTAIVGPALLKLLLLVLVMVLGSAAVRWGVGALEVPTALVGKCVAL